MKKVIIAILLTAGIASAQVSVPQSFVDQADKAFQEVVADRAVIAAKDQALAAKDQSAKDKDALIEMLTGSNKLKDAQIADLAKLKCDVTQLFLVIKIKRCH